MFTEGFGRLGRVLEGGRKVDVLAWHSDHLDELHERVLSYDVFDPALALRGDQGGQGRVRSLVDARCRVPLPGGSRDEIGAGV